MKSQALQFALFVLSATLAMGQVPPTDLTQDKAVTPAATSEDFAIAVQRQSALLNRLFGVNVQTSGAIPMAMKTRQPWQLINPFAPASFGNGFDNTSENPDTGRRQGFSLFGVKF